MWTLLQLTMFFVCMMPQVASAQNDCGNTSFSGSEGVVSSPNFPLRYPHNLRCTYSIDVGRNNSVLLKFLNFDLESPINGDQCTRDWLMITCNGTDDENLDFRNRYCGTTLPRTSLRFFNCPVVELKFFADSSVNGGGFAVEYKVLENSTSADSITDCGDTLFTSSSGSIRLPENPTDYPASVNCTYTISTNYTSTFSLDVLSFQQPQLLDSLADCSRDHIMVGCVLDGEKELNPDTSNTYCRRSSDEIPSQPGHLVFFNCSIVKISIQSSDYNYRGASSIPFTVVAYDKECGFTSFTGPTGIVTSPHFPLKYPHSLNCLYSIDVGRTKRVSLDFLSFTLEGTSNPSAMDDCSFDWITISCSSDESVPAYYPYQNRKYCGTKKSMTLSYSNCDSSLVINFVTDSSVAHGGFQLRYTITSSGDATPSTPDIPVKNRANMSFTGPTGFITSPRFPLAYPHNLDYVYSIDVSQTKTVGLYFYSFNLEGTAHPSYMDNCHYDWLLISCSSAWGNSHRNVKYCGEKTMLPILSYSNCDSLTLSFVTDSTVTSGGFKIWYTIITSAGQSDCGSTSYTGPHGFVPSPNFPLPYPHNSRCTYFIDVGRNNSVLLTFKHFELQAPNSAGYCENDWLMISCNETTKANPNNNKRYCGTIQWVSSLRFIDCPSLVLEFFSDSSTSSAGFMIEYTVVDNSNSTDDNSELDCGATVFTNASGFISLPRNPTNYLATVNCTYTISRNETSVIGINPYFYLATQFLQSFQDCDRENLMVGCVSEEETELNPKTAGVFCRRRPPTSSWSGLVFADCRTLKLTIRSNTYDYRQPLPIQFSAVEPSDICGNTSFSAPTGIVSTRRLPFPYPKRVNCLYTIDIGQINSFALIIDRLSFGYGYNTDGFCNNGSLTVTCLVNGTSMAHPLTEKKLCGYMYRITARFPACQSVLLNFSSNDLSSNTGFWLRYRFGDYELDCGSTLFTNSSGFINLPGNPTNYPATVNCTYTISANNLSYIWLDTYLSSSTELLQSFQDCDKENLMVGCLSEGETELNPRTSRIFCRQEIQSYDYTPLLFTDCRTMKLSIRSSTYDLRGTFRIPFSVVGPDNICGDTSFSTPTGVVSSRRLSFSYSKRVNCLYTIDSGHVNSLVLSIDRLSLGYGYHMGGACNNGWLKITCMVNGTSMVHSLAGRKLCESMNSITVRFAACGSVIFDFSSGSISSDIGFTVRYRIGEYVLDCGATLFNSSSGFISLPINPTNYLATVNCTYTISTNRMSDILLKTFFNSYTQLFQSFQDCDRESLTIGCVSEGGTELNPNTTRVLCRQGSPFHVSESQLVFADCRALKLSIRSSTYDNREVFRIPFSVFGTSELCGNTSFSAPTGIVSSPRLPSLFHRRINCLYVIDSGHVNSVVLSVDRLYFGPVYVSNDYDEYDYLYLYGAETRYRPLQERFEETGSCNSGWLTMTCLVNETSMAHPLANRKLCGSHHPIVARFPACRSVLLNFSSDYTGYDTGFTIRYRMGDYDPECGNTSFIGPNGFITSPRFPLSYPHNLNCLYSIAGRHRHAISLSFLSFNLDGRSNTPSMDYCYRDWLTVTCFSDDSVLTNISSSRRYCGLKTTPLKFSFPSCAVVVLNFQSDAFVSEGGFKVRFIVKDIDTLCGVPVYGGPTGTISFPWNYTDYDGSLDCNYVINATEPSSISLTIWSISLQSLVGVNCQRDWLLLTCIDGQTPLKLNVSHRTCDNLNSSIQLTFPNCTAIQVAFYRDFEATGKTFRIEYTVTSNGGPVVKMGVSGQRGRAVGISLTVIVLVAGAICLGAFLLFRRHRKKNRSEMLIQASEEETHQLEMEDDASKEGSFFRANRNQERETSNYLPLKPMSLIDDEETSPTTLH